MNHAPAPRLVHFLTTLVALAAIGCSGGLSERTLKMRTALDECRPEQAVAELDKELRVASPGALPERLTGDDALLVLDRATIQQSLGRTDKSKQDYEAADKAIDVVDMARGTVDELGRWLFSDSAGRYAAPPHEKLLIHVLDGLNYLESGDLSGARVEARRMTVMAKHLAAESVPASPVLALASVVAGLTFEKSGDAREAELYYQDAVRADARWSTAPLAAGEGVEGEILVVVGWGRVPHRVAQRTSLATAASRSALLLSSDDQAAAQRLAADAAVTWVVYPTLAPSVPVESAPTIRVDGADVAPLAVLDLDGYVRAEWKAIEGNVIAAALSRALARAAAGAAAGAVVEGGVKAAQSGEKKEDSEKAAAILGLVASLVTRATLAAADTPDTRSWETLPARIAVARVPVAAGNHRVTLEARGRKREGVLRVDRGGFRLTSLFALR